MSEIKTTKSKNKSNKFDNLQRIGFWGLIIVSLAFWTGVYLGNTAAQTKVAEQEQIKTEAIEDYKASLKD